MIASFLTPLVDSATRGVLLAPVLLICVACATPFPFEKLEKSMTAETVREEIGAPKASWRGYKQASRSTPKAGHEFLAPPGVITSSVWFYFHEKLDPSFDSGPMPLRVAVTSVFGVPFFWVCGLEVPIQWANWGCWYVSRKLVALNFEEEKLISWEVLPDIGAGAARRSPDPLRSGFWVDDLSGSPN